MYFNKQWNLNRSCNSRAVTMSSWFLLIARPECSQMNKDFPNITVKSAAAWPLRLKSIWRHSLWSSGWKSTRTWVLSGGSCRLDTGTHFGCLVYLQEWLWWRWPAWPVWGLSGVHLQSFQSERQKKKQKKKQQTSLESVHLVTFVKEKQ